MLASPPLFFEYEDVLALPEHRLVHGLSLEQVDSFVKAPALLIEPIDVRFQWRPQLADPNHDMVFEAAINGRADALVTHNVRHFAVVSRRFDLEVLAPGEILKRSRDE